MLVRVSGDSDKLSFSSPHSRVEKHEFPVSFRGRQLRVPDYSTFDTLFTLVVMISRLGSEHILHNFLEKLPNITTTSEYPHTLFTCVDVL